MTERYLTEIQVRNERVSASKPYAGGVWRTADQNTLNSVHLCATDRRN